MFSTWKEEVFKDEGLVLLSKISKQINLERASYEIIPHKGSPLFFKVFEKIDPKDVNVVILGMDPYPTYVEKNSKIPTYDGFAFSNSKSLKPSPSLRNIIKEIERSYPDNIEMDRMDFSYLVEQGVLPINTALSVRVGNPGFHIKYWKPFTELWIKNLSKKYPNIYWLLLGNEAHKFKEFITYGGIGLFGHPSPLNRTNPLIGSSAFVECNEWLNAVNKREIKW